MTILHGMIPDAIRVRSGKVVIDRLEVMADIGFHDFEIGAPQRLLVTIEVWLDDSHIVAPPIDDPASDDPAGAWDYDFLVREVRRIAGTKRYNLQETLAHELFGRIASAHGVRALRLRTVKPDVYPDAAGVGIEIASFAGETP